MSLQTELTPSVQWRLSDPVVSHGGPLLFLYEKKTWSCVTLLCFPFAAQYSSQFITYNDKHFNCYCKNLANCSTRFEGLRWIDHTRERESVGQKHGNQLKRVTNKENTGSGRGWGGGRRGGSYNQANSTLILHVSSLQRDVRRFQAAKTVAGLTDLTVTHNQFDIFYYTQSGGLDSM